MKSKLVLHQCPTCASHLKHDAEKNVFLCESCGNTYEYFCFMEDSPLATAEENLSKRKYQVAKKEYEFILTTDPHNAIALRGLELCNLGISNINKYLLPNAAPHVNFDFDSFVKRADEEHKAFFKEVSKLDSDVKATRDLNKRIEELDEEISTIEKNNERLNHLAYEEWDDVVVWRDKYKNETTAHTAFYICCLLGIGAIISAIITLVTHFSYVAIGFLVVTLLPCLIIYLMISRTLSEMREAKRRVPEAEQKLKDTKTVLRTTKEEAEKNQLKIREDYNKTKAEELKLLMAYGIIKET